MATMAMATASAQLLISATKASARLNSYSSYLFPALSLGSVSKISQLGMHIPAIKTRQERLVLHASNETPYGQDPESFDEDYIVVGLSHCFLKDEEGKLKDVFVIEPITSAGMECMDNGGKTSYKFVHATNLGVALKQDASLLPKEFAEGRFADDFDFRAKCASRTWKRPYPQQALMHLAPKEGVRGDFNFSLKDKRILNFENVVSDSDNIKQDLSIDVYGRTKEEDGKTEEPSKTDELSKEIASLYNV